MSIIRVGSNAKFADGWEKAFGGKGGKASATKTKGKPSPKKAAKKAAKKGKK